MFKEQIDYLIQEDEERTRGEVKPVRQDEENLEVLKDEEELSEII